MKKDSLNYWALSAFTALPLLSVNAQQVVTKPTNIIYIMADDLGIGDLGCYGQKKIKTPAVDKLAENGVRFTQHYTGAPVSAPSRCCLLTGKDTGHAYIRGNQSARCSDGLNYDYPLAPGETTVGDVLKQKNYVTGCFGKWGLGGPDSEGEPSKHGFDYFYGYLGQGHAHHYYPDFLWEYKKDAKEKIMLDGNYYTHDLIADKVLNFIKENVEAPFFLYFSPTIPHAELIVPEGELGEYDGLFPEIPFAGTANDYCAQPKPRATYAAMVTRLDRDVQRIIDLLKEKGIYDNTIIVFTSDNGVHKEGGNTPDFFDSNSIYRGYKRDLYEGGIRAPFVVSWPEKIKAGRVSNHPSAFWDFMPTICDLVGAEKPIGADGISYLPTLTGEGTQQKHTSMYWEFHEQNGKRAVLKDDWKLIELNVNKTGTNKFELYNITNDPSEQTNKLSGNQTKYKELKAIMDDARIANSIWNFTKLIDIPGLDILDVIGAKASSCQDESADICLSFDKDFETIYHSKYDEKNFPVTLDYSFVPAQINTIIYTTRNDGSQNGNFKEFELWVLPNGETEYIKVDDYSFKGVAGSHRIDFSGETATVMTNVTAVRFVINSGVSDLASCSEMTFYGKGNLGMEIISGQNLINVTDADASSVQSNDVSIYKTYDKDFSTRYHSSWDNKVADYFPITLNYYFDKADLQTILYYTRMDDSKNGNLKEFELWALPAEDNAFIKLNDYNFEGKSGLHRIEFNEELAEKTKGIKGVRFVVKSGTNDFASCAEMVFYSKKASPVAVSESSSEPRVVVCNRSIFLKDTPLNETFELYSSVGERLVTNTSLIPGIYFVKVGDKVSKVLVQ